MAQSQTPATRASSFMPSWFGNDPFQTLRGEMDQVLSRFAQGWGAPFANWPSHVPEIDLSETDTNLQVRADLPGIQSSEIDIQVRGNLLTVSGERKEEKEEKKKSYHIIERRSGSFSRSITLPCAVQEDKVEAEFKDGVLTITLPKAPGAQTKKITVKSS